MTSTKLNDRVGLAWAKLIAVYGQLGVIQGVLNSLMLVVVTYTTSLKPIGLPLWMYLGVLLLVLSMVVIFILTIGIRGYYQFFNEQSAIDSVLKEVRELRKELKELKEQSLGLR